MADTEDTETLAETIAPDVYEAYRLGRAGKQEYLDDWYSRAEDGPLPDVEIMRLANTILASSWLLARDERIRAEGWAMGHDAACPQGVVCSAHQPIGLAGEVEAQ